MPPVKYGSENARKATTITAIARAPRGARDTLRKAPGDAGGFSTSLDLLGLLENVDKPPALRGRQRTGLHQRNTVADTGDAVLVVGLHLLGGADDLAVERMLHAVLELDHDGLLHLVRHHVPDAGLATTARLLRP